MKTVSKKLFSLLLVAVLLVSALPFQAFAASTTTLKFWKYDFDAGSYTLASEKVIDSSCANYNQKDPAIQAPAGWKFDGWVLYDGAMSFEQVNAAGRVSKNKVFEGTVSFAAAYVRDTASVEFVTNVNGVGADVAKPANIKFINNKPFGYTANFVNIENAPKGYTFGGWKFGDTIVNSGNWSTVTFKSSVSTKLYAYWIPDDITVSFYSWKGDQYELFGTEKVKYGASPKEYQGFDKDDLDTKDLYEFVGWNDKDGNPVTPSNVTITKNTSFYARYLGDEVTITLNPKDGNLKSQTKIVRIGEKIGAYGGKLPTPSLTGYVFMGWYDANDNQVTDNDVFWNSYSTLYAKWAPQGNVRLIVYKEGDYTSPIVDRKIPNGVRGGTLDVDNIQIGNYLPSGNTYKLTGYFDQDGWTDFTKNRIVNTVDYVQVSNNDETAVYAIVSVVSGNNDTGSGSNNTGNGNNSGSNKPADPTNPATGDDSMIFASMTVMTLAAAALVVMMQLRKRKMI